ncbi:glycoside hydrolase family 15 protein [Actinomadura logoneensis]|uniref:Glycoside hydrolase family 15 protein n=1 Tax=Actinomadura logoneensis TaxID=2293572 RepID=A0A372JCU5_9ACTN|nr:glycoside hydrolase family 15 protein [Actinomadura logoneensis]RFU37208.1 glycoside hydrolase family 15 protein [Actinomadura logoneensis]
MLHVLRDYAFVGDGERGALIGPHGDFAWMCFPSWESPPVFAGLLGGPGTYVVCPVAERRVWGGYYEDACLVWRSRWVVPGGVVECHEALGGPAETGRTVVLRRIRCVGGTATVRVRLGLPGGECRWTAVPAPQGSGADDSWADGSWTGRAGDVYFRWTGAPESASGRPLTFDFDLREGETRDLVLELSTRPVDGPPGASGASGGLGTPDELWEQTRVDWKARIPDCSDTIAPRDARLAYAVLTGLTSSSGGMAAAATTSLPEHLAGTRNFDYRYAWIRDQCIAGQAVAAHGGRLALLDAATGFVADRLAEDGARMRPAYTVSGGPVPAEHPAGLPGYPGSDAVYGNRVTGQFQLDVFGEALLLFAAAARHDRVDAHIAEAAAAAVRAIGERWHEADYGVWETEPRCWTHSRLACVAGLRRAAPLLAARGDRADWERLADRILSETARTSLDDGGGWQRAADDDRVDAALLLPALRGAFPPDDPHMTATYRRVRAELEQEGFVYRYRVARKPLGEIEGAFTLCGFMLAMADFRHGEREMAVGQFERARSACGATGLFAEEYDVRQRQVRGNLPQAFVHALFLEAATRLAAR